MEYSIGQIVYSKSGRDKNLPFIVISVEGDYLYLADGELRKLEQPKRKKIKHVQGTNYVNIELKEKLETGSYIQNAELVKVLKQYNRNDSVTN